MYFHQSGNLTRFPLTFLIVIFLLLQTNLLNGQSAGRKVIHPLMGKFSLSVETGGTLGFTDYENSNVDFIWRTSLEYYFKTFTNHMVGLKAYVGNGNINGNDADIDSISEFKTDLFFFGANITYGYRVSETLLPTISAGLSSLKFEPKDRDGNVLVGSYDKTDVIFNSEIGLRFFITNDFSLNANAGLAFSFNDFLDGHEKGTQNDLYYTSFLGLSYTIDAMKDADHDGVEDSDDACPDTHAGVEVDDFGCPTDNDRDGVADYLDKCPNTPARVQVDENGCPLDSDRDRVPDYIDRCPNTPSGVRVNRNGCPQDSDLDGIPDFVDKCPETPRGIRVDNNGCPMDSDGDGVPDFADRCASTPRGVQVNNSGCPLDTDSDGVPDYLDKCPNTPPGTEVTLDGCSNEFQEYIFNASTLFNEGQAILTPESYDELNKVIARVKLRPNARWRIEGHTDEKGTPVFNKVLSLQRSQAVFNYFVSQGLNPEKFEVVGLGEDFPIADNTTPEGRKINRRVSLIRIE